MEFFTLLLLEPRLAAYAISEQDIGYKGFFLLFCSLISFYVGNLLFLSGGSATTGITPLFFIPILFVFSVFFLWILSALYNYFAEMMGAPGRSLRFFKVLPFAALPFLFLTPTALILSLVFPNTKGFIYLPLMLAFFLWSLYILIRLLEGIYGLESHKALTVSLLPWAVFLLFLIGTPFLISFTGLALAVML
ncbi:MAG: YIP1 family protein [Elusimicrobia bacterium]|nr:YIP1 family protein [Elusimicrobiota bacterium]